MSPRVPNFSFEEINIMISALERDRDLVTKELGKSIKNMKEQSDRWDAVADLINAIGLGQERKGQQVRRKWNDLKYKIKKKAADLKNDILKTGGGDPNYELYLSQQELRILSLLGTSSYEGSTGLKFDLAAAKNSGPISPSQAEASFIPEPTTPQSSTMHQSTYFTPQSSTSQRSPLQTSICTPTPSSNILQSFSLNHQSQSFLNGSTSTEYNDLITEENPLPDDHEGSESIIGRNNKENEPSWIFGHKDHSESSGTRRKRNSRDKKRKIFDESDTEATILETQDQMKNCLLALKEIGEKQLKNQENMLHVLHTISGNQGLIINKLNEIANGQNTNNVLLQTIGNVQFVNE